MNSNLSPLAQACISSCNKHSGLQGRTFHKQRTGLDLAGDTGSAFQTRQGLCPVSVPSGSPEKTSGICVVKNFLSQEAYTVPKVKGFASTTPHGDLKDAPSLFCLETSARGDATQQTLSRCTAVGHSGWGSWMGFKPQGITQVLEHQVPGGPRAKQNEMQWAI